jgi:hypothetical protein
MDTLSLSQHIWGSLNPDMFFAALLFAMIGVTISLLMHAGTRNKTSTSTAPPKFNFWFLLTDNWKRILLSFILIVVTIRFLKELTGLNLNMFFALCIGVAWDKLSEFIKAKSDILKVDRPV